jgi:hypothetical protein
MGPARRVFGRGSRPQRILTLVVAAGAIAVALPITTGRAADPSCEWLAGDFHVHTVYSHDSYGGPDDPGTGPDEFYTLGWTPGQQGAIAESRGLDFIAITDHNSVDGYTARDTAATGLGFYESGWGRADQVPGGQPLIWVPDYENSVSGAGHAQMHGATQVYDRSLPAPQAAAALHADGGAFQINHPSDMNWHDAAGNFNYPGFAPDSLEVWNIGVWLYQPPFPATNDHEFPVAMYDGFLDQGFRVAATGGSDNHWRSTTAAQGVGQPTTWVCAEDRSPEAIVAAVRANRTSVSHQPPAYGGSRAYLSADGDGDGTFEAMVGDSVAPGSKIEAVVENAEGATLRLVTNGGEVLAEETVTSPDFANAYEVPPDATWVRAEVFYPDGREARRELQPVCDLSNQLFGQERDSRNTYCENRLAMLAMTSPIYFSAGDFDPATSLTYDGDRAVRVGREATLSATLRDAAGDTLASQPVTFAFRDQTLQATTNDSGRASVRTRVAGPARDEVVHVGFAGTDTYDPAHEEATLRVTASK